MKKIPASCFVSFIYCIYFGFLPLQPVLANTNLFPMPSSENKTVSVEIDQEAVSHIYSYPRLVEWCEMEQSSDLASQLWELSFIRSCGKEFVEAYNRNTIPPLLLWMMLKQPLCRDYLWMITRNQLPLGRAGMEASVRIPGMARLLRMASSSDYSIQPGTFLPQKPATTSKSGKPSLFMCGCSRNSPVGRIYQKGSTWNKQTVWHFFNR